ncbi:hypothetical protein RB195_020007 [Necator americanus]|uniref:Uncharacterized protein n=1 Tax=Necator americanus TaxID=51031 RepID=A0ABR1CGT4_NECAM
MHFRFGRDHGVPGSSEQFRRLRRRRRRRRPRPCRLFRIRLVFALREFSSLSPEERAGRAEQAPPTWRGPIVYESVVNCPSGDSDYVSAEPRQLGADPSRIWQLIYLCVRPAPSPSSPLPELAHPVIFQNLCHGRRPIHIFGLAVHDE